MDSNDMNNNSHSKSDDNIDEYNAVNIKALLSPQSNAEEIDDKLPSFVSQSTFSQIHEDVTPTSRITESATNPTMNLVDVVDAAIEKNGLSKKEILAQKMASRLRELRSKPKTLPRPIQRTTSVPTSIPASIPTSTSASAPTSITTVSEIDNEMESTPIVRVVSEVHENILINTNIGTTDKQDGHDITQEIQSNQHIHPIHPIQTMQPLQPTKHTQYIPGNNEQLVPIIEQQKDTISAYLQPTMSSRGKVDQNQRNDIPTTRIPITTRGPITARQPVTVRQPITARQPITTRPITTPRQTIPLTPRRDHITADITTTKNTTDIHTKPPVPTATTSTSRASTGLSSRGHTQYLTTSPLRPPLSTRTPMTSMTPTIPTTLTTSIPNKTTAITPPIPISITPSTPRKEMALKPPTSTRPPAPEGVLSTRLPPTPQILPPSSARKALPLQQPSSVRAHSQVQALPPLSSRGVSVPFSSHSISSARSKMTSRIQSIQLQHEQSYSQPQPQPHKYQHDIVITPSLSVLSSTGKIPAPDSSRLPLSARTATTTQRQIQTQVQAQARSQTHSQHSQDSICNISNTSNALNTSITSHISNTSTTFSTRPSSSQTTQSSLPFDLPLSSRGNREGNINTGRVNSGNVGNSMSTTNNSSVRQSSIITVAPTSARSRRNSPPIQLRSNVLPKSTTSTSTSEYTEPSFMKPTCSSARRNYNDDVTSSVVSDSTESLPINPNTTISNSNHTTNTTHNNTHNNTTSPLLFIDSNFTKHTSSSFSKQTTSICGSLEEDFTPQPLMKDSFFQKKLSEAIHWNTRANILLSSLHPVNTNMLDQFDVSDTTNCTHLSNSNYQDDTKINDDSKGVNPSAIDTSLSSSSLLSSQMYVLSQAELDYQTIEDMQNTSLFLQSNTLTKPTLSYLRRKSMVAKEAAISAKTTTTTTTTPHHQPHNQSQLQSRNMTQLGKIHELDDQRSGESSDTTDTIDSMNKTDNSIYGIEEEKRNDDVPTQRGKKFTGLPNSSRFKPTYSARRGGE